MAQVRRKKNKESLEALIASDLKDQILSSVADGISVQDLDLRIVFVNDKLRSMFGDDIIGRYCYEIYERNETQCEGCPVLECYETGETARKVRTGFDKDGNNVTVEICASPIRDGDGSIIAGVEVVRDLAEQEAMQEEIDEKTSRLERLAEVSREVSSGLDLGRVLQQVAHQATGIIGADAAMVALADEKTGTVNFPIAYNLPDPLRQITTRIGEGISGSVIADGEPRVDNDYQASSERNEAFAAAGVQAVITVPLKASDRCLGALGVMNLGGDRKFSESDIEVLETISRQAAVAIENAQLYEELARSARELEERVFERTEELSRLYEESQSKSRELEEANIRLKEVDRLKSEFLANMSHELRTPLNSIIGFSKLILDGLDGALNSEQRRDLEIVHTSGQALTRLIDDVLSLAKIEAGRVALDIREQDPVKIIEDAIESCEKLIVAKGLALERDLPPDVIPIRVDGDRIKQVIGYLIENAVKFTEEGTVRVSLEQSDGKTDFMVADTGIGLEADQIDVVFERFHQVSPGLAEKGGMGLGLAISKRLVEMHGGTIGVTSRIGSGSTFTVSIPQG